MKKEATVEDLPKSARRWLTEDVYVLEVHPYPSYETASSIVDRSKRPAPGAPTDARFPALQRTNLSNGARIILAERHAAPLVTFDLQIDGGSPADQFALPGTARLAMDLLSQVTARP